jgi:ABC-type glycerol-3-phosphate transport system substrate-binding protein
MSLPPLITRLRRLATAALLVGLASLTASCSAFGRQDDGQLSGRILFWHSWSGEEAVVLNDMLNQFSALHPGVRIITTVFDETAIHSAYTERTRAGLGPDLTLVDNAVAYELWLAGMVRELPAAESIISPSRFQNSPYQMVNDAEHLIGLPFATHTQVLFFDRERVLSLPLTAEQLAEMARTGLPLAMQTSYPATHWLLGNYYGRILNDAGRLELERGGAVNWLSDLQVTTSSPGIYLDDRPAALRRLLSDGTVAFYIGDSTELPLLRQALGDRLGVSTLPIGPFGGPASPMLQADTLIFSPVTSAREQRIALQLAEFLTNTQTQIQLATANVGRIPAGAEASGSNVPAESLVISRQIRSAQVVSLALRPNWNLLFQTGGAFQSGYRAALAGVTSPIAFVTQYGLEREPSGLSVVCPARPGAVTLWHSLPAREVAAIVDIARRFAAACPGNDVALSFVAEDAIFERFSAAGARRPDMILTSSRWLPRLAERGLIRDIADEVPPEALQTYVPAAVVNMTYRNRLFAIPESISNTALVFNRSAVIDPPIDLEGLLNQAATGRRVALPVGFFDGYWGMAPFGTFEFDSSRRTLSSINGLAGWLQWLQQNQNRPGMGVTFDAAAAEAEFLAGDAAFLVTGPWSLPRLRRQFAADELGVTSLPFGPLGAGAPLLRTNGILVSSRADEETVAVAVAFAQYLNRQESQSVLSDMGTRVSANVMVDLTAYPLLNGFREQARAGVVAVENEAFAEMAALGDETYRSVLEDGANPFEATSAFVTAVHTSGELTE